MTNNSSQALRLVDISDAPLATIMLHQLQQQPNPNQHIATALEENYPSFNVGLPMRYTYRWQQLNRGRYAEQALLTGAIVCVDPRNGVLRTSKRAWVLPGYWLGIAYEFEGVDSFFLITSNWNQLKLGIWFPQSSLFVAGHVIADWLQIGVDCVETLRSQITKAHVWQVLPNNQAASRPGVLHLGFCNNLGHYMWNDLSGLEAVLQAGSEHKIETIVVGPHEYFPIDKLYPEFERAGVRIQRWTKPLSTCVKHEDTLPLRIAGNRISRDLRRRIVAWALESSGAELRELSRYNDNSLNLWFNLRLHNKAWAGQIDGIVAIAEAARRSLPAPQSLRLFLDGTPDTSAIADSIAGRLEGTAEVVNATCVSLARSITLTSLIDLHVCVIGSGLTLPHWVMGRRGVAHSNRQHMSQQSFWNNVAEGTHDVSFVPVHAITDHDGPIVPDAGYVNYDMSPSAVLEQLDVIYRQHDNGPRMSGVEQMIVLGTQGYWAHAAERVISV